MFNPLNLNQWKWGLAILEDNVLCDQLAEGDIAVAEQRDKSRSSFSIPICYRKSGKQNPWKVAKSLDVSKNGIRLILSGNLAIGTSMEMDVKLPKNAEPVRLNGSIVWIKPAFNGEGLFECGIVFDPIGVRAL